LPETTQMGFGFFLRMV